MAKVHSSPASKSAARRTTHNCGKIALEPKTASQTTPPRKPQTRNIPSTNVFLPPLVYDANAKVSAPDFMIQK